jgi:hypothetical protein
MFVKKEILMFHFHFIRRLVQQWRLYQYKRALQELRALNPQKVSAKELNRLQIAVGQADDKCKACGIPYKEVEKTRRSALGVQISSC